MNDKQYYRTYSTLITLHERLSYKIVLKAFKSIYKHAADEYLANPSIPIELLVKESDTLKMLTDIYDSVGIATALMVSISLPKQKHANFHLETKARKPKQYQQTPDQNDQVNYWKQEFLRFTQSTDCAKKVSQVTNTTKQQIAKVIEQSVKEQLSHKQVAKRILEQADAIGTKKRALLIARTENCIGSNLGAMAGAKSSGLVLYKKWIARSGDNRTRDSHASMIGKDPIPMDSAFKVGDIDMMHPGDASLGAKANNICNCRCTVGFIPASEVVQTGLSNPKPERKPRVVKPKPRPVKPDLFDTPILVEDRSVFKPASTVAEAAQYAIDQGFAKNVKYDFIKDVNAANEMNKTLFDLKERFNFDTLIDLGTNTSGKALMSANFKTLNIKNSYWKTQKMIRNNYLKDHNGMYQQRILRNLEVSRSNYELNKNSIWIKHIRQLEEQVKYKRWTVSYSEETYLQNTIHHEFGHILHDQMLAGINGTRALNVTRVNKMGYKQMAQQLNEEHIELYRLASKNGDIYKVSAYGSTNNKEFFSETFVMYMAKDPELPIYIKEFFDKMFTLTKL
jgi:hypothetical protein